MGPCWAAPCTTPVSHFSFMSLIIFNPHLDLLSQPFSTLYPTVQPNLQRALSPAPWSRRSPGARNILPTRRSLAPLQKMYYDFVSCACRCERNLYACLYIIYLYDFTSWATNQYYSVVANESLLTLQCWCFTFRWWLMSASVVKKWTELLRKESCSLGIWLALRKNKICQIICLVWNSNRRVETCLVINQNTSVKGIGLQQANNCYVRYTCAWHIQIYRMLNPSICSIACFAGIDVPWSEPPHLSVIAIICEVNLWSDAHNFASTVVNWQGEWGKNSTDEGVTEMSALREVPLLSHPSIFYCLLNQDYHGSLGVGFFLST